MVESASGTADALTIGMMRATAAVVEFALSCGARFSFDSPAGVDGVASCFDFRVSVALTAFSFIVEMGRMLAVASPAQVGAGESDLSGEAMIVRRGPGLTFRLTSKSDLESAPVRTPSIKSTPCLAVEGTSFLVDAATSGLTVEVIPLLVDAATSGLTFEVIPLLMDAATSGLTVEVIPLLVDAATSGLTVEVIP